MKQLLALLEKAHKGAIKPGHKYTSRTRKNGRWVYDYSEAKKRQADLASKLGGMKARLAAQPAPPAIAASVQATPPALVVQAAPLRQVYSRGSLAPDPTDEKTLVGKLAKLERVICFRPIEEGHVFMPNGRRIMARRGIHDPSGDGQFIKWTYPEAERMLGCTMTHNHPLMADGTSFTMEDIAFAVNYNLHEIRAVGQRYRHSMIIPTTFGKLTGDHVATVYAKYSSDVHVSLLGKVRSGEVTIADAELQHRHSVWERAATELGLRYTREEWLL